MSSIADREYYLAREAAERALAQRAPTREIARVHKELAERYADMAAGRPVERMIVER